MSSSVAWRNKQREPPAIAIIAVHISLKITKVAEVTELALISTATTAVSTTASADNTVVRTIFYTTPVSLHIASIEIDLLDAKVVGIVDETYGSYSYSSRYDHSCKYDGGYNSLASFDSHNTFDSYSSPNESMYYM
ncbi:hypothetical protein BX070DRAFT_249513 [Coemansia spiralis]|nr:hypothetical protein BX070DRAFT_249513 [Coemansia spiralis]